MKDHIVFIGTGINPNGLELPMGFGMKLPQNPKALDTYSRMSKAEQEALIRFIQASESGDDAKRRISTAIERLNEGETNIA